MAKSRGYVGKITETKRFEKGSLAFFLIYVVFVLVTLSFSELLDKQEETLILIDMYFLIIFMAEIGIKTFVIGLKYFLDY